MSNGNPVTYAEKIRQDAMDAGARILDALISDLVSQGAPATTTPCADCGTTGGFIDPRWPSKPTRSSGAPYGFDGTLCNSCRLQGYYRLHPRPSKRQPKVVAEPTAPDKTKSVACADCGTTGGLCDSGQTRPRRRKGKPFGIEGMLCHKCYFKHRSQVKLSHKAKPRPAPVVDLHPEPYAADPEVPKLTPEQSRLVAENQGLVYKAAKKYLNCGLDFDDLVGEGQLGLLHACVGFDPSRGAFSTYATWCIWGTIKHALTHKSRVIKIPADQQAELNESGGSHLAISEAQLGWSLASIPEDRDAGLSDNREAVEMAVASLSTLPERHATILRLRFGIGTERQTLREIADDLGVTKERVRQIEAKALETLRKQVGVAS